MTDKAALVAAFRARILERIAALDAEALSARDGTRVDGDHRPANRGERAAVTGQGYLALGIGQRLAQLRDDLVALDAVAPGPRDRVVNGALITIVDEDDVTRRLLVLPGGLGDEFDGVRVVSPDAPLARALTGARVGHTATAIVAGREIELEVEAIS